MHHQPPSFNNNNNNNNNCSSKGLICEYLSPLQLPTSITSPGIRIPEGFTEELGPLSSPELPLNLSCGFGGFNNNNINGLHNKPPELLPKKPMDIIRAVAQEELIKLQLSKSKLSQPSNINIVNGDHDYDKVIRHSEGNCHGLNGPNGLIIGDDKSIKSKEGSSKTSGSKRFKSSRDGDPVYERSEILRAETSIIATFIAKVKETRKRKSFGKTYHVIKPRAHLYLPNKCSKKVVQDRYDVPSEEIDSSEDYSEMRINTSPNTSSSSNPSRSSLKSIENFIDEQIQHQKELSVRWEAVFRKIQGDERFEGDGNGCGIPKLTHNISEKNEAIAKSLDECKLMMGMIQEHKQQLIRVAQDWNTSHGF